jgi:signal transduction histidine kinase
MQIKFSKAITEKKKVIGVLVACSIIASGITYILYGYTQSLLKERLQDRLIAIVATAAEAISYKDVEYVRDTGQLGSAEMLRLVNFLQDFKNANSNVSYAYIMRRTDVANTLEFVADAESLSTIEELDLNADGVVDDSEVAPLPGDPFDVSEYPALRDVAFKKPIAADDLEQDQWSLQLSAYAPILSDGGEAVAIVGIDVVVEDFRERTQTTLRPFLLFIIFLVLLLTLLTLILLRYSAERENFLRELDRQKDELLGIVSHQLATPISALKWDFEMLLDGDFGEFNAEQKSFFGKLQEVARHLADLASMILDVSRIQLGRMKVDRTDLDLQAFFGEILTVMEAKAQERKVNLVSSIPKDIGSASLDKRLMHMIVENLMSNAIKYTPEKGKVKLDVSLVGKELKISVSDTGCGIPIKDQDKIFGKLFRASNVRSVDGNGFGLFVVKGATEAQGGTITFESKENVGTTFKVNLQLP